MNNKRKYTQFSKKSWLSDGSPKQESKLHKKDEEEENENETFKQQWPERRLWTHQKVIKITKDKFNWSDSFFSKIF